MIAATDLRVRLAAMADGELLARAPADAVRSPWGASGAVDVDGVTVFVKQVPLTDVEAGAPGSTANHFDLPTYYSYGMGSAGFGVWRELAVHQAVDGLPGFPALLHHRVMPRTLGAGPLPWSDEEYVRYWNGSEAIGRYMRARADASHELWIVLEHVPHEVGPWLMANQHEIDAVLRQLFEAISVLHDRGIRHFDSHLGNAVTDGRRVRLGDFGLAMATSFDLSGDERAMLDRHRHYDEGVLLGSIGLAASLALGGYMPARDLAGRIDQLRRDPAPFDPAFASALVRYRDPIAYMVDFFDRMRSPEKRSTYDDDTFAELLRAAGTPLR
jgi:hypothetical protein